MKTICEVNQCTGCMACVNACRLDAVSLIKTINKVKVIIDEEKCVHCGACLKVCPTHNSVEKHTSIMWKQGWAEDQYRKQGSSGGVASAVIAAFIKKGGYVCSCLFDKGEFTFICTNNLEKAKRFAGSKYVKSTPGYIYREVDKLLKNGEKVLFVGLPCQVAAAKNFISQNHQENLYTIDLICHGTPNDVVLDIYLKQHGVSKKNISDIKFRNIVGMGLTIDGNSVSVKGTVDRYLLSFMNALIYTENCYQCQYAVNERISDLTLGDSWGTDLVSEMKQGVSLLLCQTDKGKMLLDMANLVLYDVNIQQALASNGNLSHPSVAPSTRDEFFEKLSTGANYDKLVMKAFPKQCIRQNIKAMAIKLKLK